MLSLAKRAAGALSQPAAQAARLMSTSVAIPNEPDLYMIEQGPSNTAETSKEELMTVGIVQGCAGEEGTLTRRSTSAT